MEARKGTVVVTGVKIEFLMDEAKLLLYRLYSLDLKSEGDPLYELQKTLKPIVEDRE